MEAHRPLRLFLQTEEIERCWGFSKYHLPSIFSPHLLRSYLPSNHHQRSTLFAIMHQKTSCRGGGYRRVLCNLEMVVSILARITCLSGKSRPKIDFRASGQDTQLPF